MVKNYELCNLHKLLTSSEYEDIIRNMNEIVITITNKSL